MVDGDRNRIPVDDPYVMALGRATYVFATLEWNAVWCCERMQAGYIRGLGRKTAGIIAADFHRLSQRRPTEQARNACVPPAEEFKRLVVLRNGILHGKPGTAPGGEQRLFRDGAACSISDLENAADAFGMCGIALNALLYGELSKSS